MDTLNDRIIELEKQVTYLLDKISDLSKNTEETNRKPISIVGGIRDKSNSRPSDIETGFGQVSGGNLIFNDSELKAPPFGAQPATPTKGYNVHFHGEYSGGALAADVLQIVQYDWGSITNKESLQYLKTNQKPKIKKQLNTNKQSVNMIGALDLIFDADTQKWGVSAFKIDIKKCLLIEYDDDGVIAKDSKGNDKKSYLYNEDSTKSAIVWDENAQVWRFYAVYAPGTSTP